MTSTLTPTLNHRGHVPRHFLMRTFPITFLLAAALVAGCATTQPTGNIANTVALIDATVPLAVAVAVSHDANTVPKFQLAAGLIDTAAGTQPADPTALVAQIHALGMKPEAELAVLGGVALWQAYLAQNPDALPSDTKLLLQTVAKDIRAGLPPATPDSLRKAGKGKRR